MNDLGLKGASPGASADLGLKTASSPQPALTEDELRELEEASRQRLPAVKRIRHTHHRWARLMAAGYKDVEISAIAKVSQSRLSILKNDPAFMDLVKYYLQREEENQLEVSSHLLTMGLDFAGELHERLLDSPEDLSNKVLLDATIALLDRSGHAPVSRSVSATLTGSLSPDQQAAMKEDLRRAHAGNVTTKSGLRPTVGRTLNREPEVPPRVEEGEQGTGAGVREEGEEVARAQVVKFPSGE